MTTPDDQRPKLSDPELADVIAYGSDSYFWPGPDFGERGTTYDVLVDLRETRFEVERLRAALSALGTPE